MFSMVKSKIQGSGRDPAELPTFLRVLDRIGGSWNLFHLVEGVRWSLNLFSRVHSKIRLI